MRDDEFLSLMKSTIVRSQSRPWWLPLARAAGATLSAVGPSVAARLAERMFLTPPRHRPPAGETAALATARSSTTRLRGRRLHTWAWGTGPAVLLVHGWGGRGAQLAAFVGPLVARGYTVVAFDAPGHGVSARELVTVPDMVDAIRAVASDHAPLHGLIAHSIGAAAAVRAIYEGLEVGAAVLMGPPAELVTPSIDFATALGLSRQARGQMQQRIERRVGMPWSAFDVTRLAPALDVPLLVIHDRGDGEVPWQHGAAITRAWAGATLLTTDGLGHRRILRDPGVVAAAASFLAGARSAASSAGFARAIGPGGGSEGAVEAPFDIYTPTPR